MSRLLVVQRLSKPAVLPESAVSLSQGYGYLSCSGAVELGILLPHLARVIVEGVTVGAGLLLVMARAYAPEAACPKCGTTSGRPQAGLQLLLQDAG